MTDSTTGEEYDGYEDYHGPLTPHQQRERVWSAHSAGYVFRFRKGPDADPVSDDALAELADALSETEPATEANREWRARLMRVYLDGVNYWRKLAGEPLAVPPAANPLFAANLT